MEPGQPLPMNKPQPPQDDSPWWLKHSVRGISIIAALVAMGLGVFACITVYPTCMLAGILQLVVGFFVIVVEAPCLCPFLDFAQVPGRFFDGKPYWMRSIIYGAISILPIIICPGISTIFGAGLIFVAGTLYGVLALGRKADSSVMRTRAASMSNLIPNQNQTAQFVNDPMAAELAEQGIKKVGPGIIAQGFQ